jgi:hypothetical protein
MVVRREAEEKRKASVLRKEQDWTLKASHTSW